jgi:polyisoprenyl-phosphate glycosyltransferase
MTLAVIAPFFNESAHVSEFLERLLAIVARVDVDSTVMCVNDGSTDDTLARLIEAHEREPRIKVIDFSRNFGKEFALTAGLDYSNADAVVLIDSDLQHPPEMLPAMVAKWREGYEVVYMLRQSRSEASLFTRLGRQLFYFVFRLTSNLRLPPEAGDFRLLDAKVVAAVRLLPERTRFMKGIFHWVGFRQIGLTYEETLRQADSSKWGLWKLIALAIDGISAFSNLPLHIWGMLGAAIAGLSLMYAASRIIRYFIYGVDVPGFESIIVAVLFLGGVQLLSLGVLGAYIGRIFAEVKHRPLYIVRQTYGFDCGTDEPAEKPHAELNRSTR